VIDRFASAGRDRAAMLRVFLLGAVLSVPLALAPLFPSLLATLAFLFFAMFIAASFVIGSVAYATAVYSTRYSGLISGIGAGSWSAWVALVMPWIGRLFDLHDYGAAFVLAGVAPLVGFALWVPLSRKS